MNSDQQFTKRSIASADGTALAFRFYPGEAEAMEGIPLVAVPGLGMPAEIWFATINALQRQRPIAIIEPRGSGFSGPIRSDVDGTTFASDAIAVMDHLGWARAHVAGISMGSMIAQHVAVRHRERVQSLTLVCSYARPGPWTRHVWQLRLALAEHDVNLARLAAVLFLTSPQSVDDDERVITRLMNIWATSPVDPASYLSQMRFCASHDLHQALTALTSNSPLGALVVDAEWDLLCPSTTSSELAGLLNARLVRFPTGTHLLAGDRPTELGEVMGQHLVKFDEVTFDEAKFNEAKFARTGNSVTARRECRQPPRALT
jgi:pimeloyl-ACP methyl ester carboxylesterase